MSNKLSQMDSPTDVWKNEAARQRWELFHRAIEHAKQTNAAAMQADYESDSEIPPAGPLLFIAR